MNQNWDQPSAGEIRRARRIANKRAVEFAKSARLFRIEAAKYEVASCQELIRVEESRLEALLSSNKKILEADHSVTSASGEAPNEQVKIQNENMLIIKILKGDSIGSNEISNLGELREDLVRSKEYLETVLSLARPKLWRRRINNGNSLAIDSTLESNEDMHFSEKNFNAMQNISVVDKTGNVIEDADGNVVSDSAENDDRDKDKNTWSDLLSKYAEFSQPSDLVVKVSSIKPDDLDLNDDFPSQSVHSEISPEIKLQKLKISDNDAVIVPTVFDSVIDQEVEKDTVQGDLGEISLDSRVYADILDLKQLYTKAKNDKQKQKSRESITNVSSSFLEEKNFNRRLMQRVYRLLNIKSNSSNQDEEVLIETSNNVTGKIDNQSEGLRDETESELIKSAVLSNSYSNVDQISSDLEKNSPETSDSFITDADIFDESSDKMDGNKSEKAFSPDNIEHFLSVQDFVQNAIDPEDKSEIKSDHIFYSVENDEAVIYEKKPDEWIMNNEARDLETDQRANKNPTFLERRKSLRDEKRKARKMATAARAILRAEARDIADAQIESTRRERLELKERIKNERKEARSLYILARKNSKLEKKAARIAKSDLMRSEKNARKEKAAQKKREKSKKIDFDFESTQTNIELSEETTVSESMKNEYSETIINENISVVVGMDTPEFADIENPEDVTNEIQDGNVIDKMNYTELNISPDILPSVKSNSIMDSQRADSKNDIEAVKISVKVETITNFDVDSSGGVTFADNISTGEAPEDFSIIDASREARAAEGNGTGLRRWLRWIVAKKDASTIAANSAEKEKRQKERDLKRETNRVAKAEKKELARAQRDADQQRKFEKKQEDKTLRLNQKINSNKERDERKRLDREERTLSKERAKLIREKSSLRREEESQNKEELKRQREADRIVSKISSEAKIEPIAGYEVEIDGLSKGILNRVRESLKMRRKMKENLIDSRNDEAVDKTTLKRTGKLTKDENKALKQQLKEARHRTSMARKQSAEIAKFQRNERRAAEKADKIASGFKKKEAESEKENLKRSFRNTKAEEKARKKDAEISVREEAQRIKAIRKGEAEQKRRDEKMLAQTAKQERAYRKEVQKQEKKRANQQRSLLREESKIAKRVSKFEMPEIAITRDEPALGSSYQWDAESGQYNTAGVGSEIDASLYDLPEPLPRR